MTLSPDEGGSFPAMSTGTGPRIAVVPDAAPGFIGDAVVKGGGVLVPTREAEGLIWGDPRDAAGLALVLRDAPDLRWIQLTWAGIENFADAVDGEHEWTCAKGVYAEPVAEHALAFALAGLRGLGAYARAQRWEGPRGTNLLGAHALILGGGGIAESLVRLLGPFDGRITVMRKRVSAMVGVDEVVGSDRLHDVLPEADVVFVALALTPETLHIIGRDELALMQRHAWLVNVARGRHVDTDALVDALREGVIGGAGLDVTDPEPLPAGHPLWELPNCIVTPHTGNTPEMAAPLLSQRIVANVKRFANGEPLIGPIERGLGY
jgi:phosphoglycerate dehydrogenase-like enzyme